MEQVFVTQIKVGLKRPKTELRSHENNLKAQGQNKNRNTGVTGWLTKSLLYFGGSRELSLNALAFATQGANGSVHLLSLWEKEMRVDIGRARKCLFLG